MNIRTLNWNVAGRQIDIERNRPTGASLSRTLHLLETMLGERDLAVLTEVPHYTQAQDAIRSIFADCNWETVTSTGNCKFPVMIAAPAGAISKDGQHTHNSDTITFLSVEVTLHDNTYRVVAARVKTGKGRKDDYLSRADGLRELVEHIADMQSRHPEIPVIGGGDFNHARIHGNPHKVSSEQEIDEIYAGLLQLPVAFQRIDNMFRAIGMQLHVPASGGSHKGIALDHMFTPEWMSVQTRYGTDLAGSDHLPELAVIDTSAKTPTSSPALPETLHSDALIARVQEASSLLGRTATLHASGITVGLIARLIAERLNELPNLAVTDLSPGAFWQETPVSVSGLARALDVSRPSLLAAFQRSEDAGILRVTQRNRQNFIQFTPA